MFLLMPNRRRLGRQACDDDAVTPDRFADRLDAATYEGDEVLGVFKADELHTLPMLGGSAAVPLNQQGCHSLLDELAEGAWV
jgi:hypothetical protein